MRRALGRAERGLRLGRLLLPPPLGIRAFGNTGSRFDDIRDAPLSARDRQKVSVIVREEQRSGCRE